MADDEPVVVEESPRELATVDDEPIRPPDGDFPVVIQRSARALVWQARIGFAVGVIGVALAVIVLLVTRGDSARNEEFARVLDAAEIVALRVTTFEGSNMDAWVEDTQALATGSYADEVAQLFDPEVRQGLAEAEVNSVGEILSSFVQAIDGNQATVFLVLRQTYSNNLQPQTISDELRMEVQLTKVNDQWLASDVVALGDSVFGEIAASETEQDEEE